MKNDRYFLRLAIEEGNKKTIPYNFGAVVVKGGKIIAKDHNHVAETNNPSLHAEMSTIINACKEYHSANLPEGCILYCSHEPCFMCITGAAWAQIDRIIYSNPAKDNKDFKYNFADLTIGDFVNKLPREMTVDYIELKDD